MVGTRFLNSLLMASLPPQAIDEFQVLWKRRYGVQLPRDEATVRAHQVFALIHLVARGYAPSPSTAADPASPLERSEPETLGETFDE